MKRIHIYMVLQTEIGAVVYVGASMQKPSCIDRRHKARFGKNHHVEILDIAKSVSRAANLEEYWFWQMRSWGFKLQNKLPFKRYHYNEKENWTPIDWDNYYLSNTRLSKAAIESILVFEDLYKKIMQVIRVKTDATMRKVLSQNKWNGRLTYYQCMLDIKQRTGLSEDDIWETRRLLLKDSLKLKGIGGIDQSGHKKQTIPE